MLVVCAVFDSAIQAFGQPFVTTARGAAIRSFSDAIARPADPSDLSNHPDDFDLYYLGDFDQDTGVFSGTKEMLIRGKDVLKGGV